jgi:hypothetical protein
MYTKHFSNKKFTNESDEIERLQNLEYVQDSAEDLQNESQTPQTPYTHGKAIIQTKYDFKQELSKSHKTSLSS